MSMNVREELLALADTNYRSFSLRLLPAGEKVLSVRLPAQQKILESRVPDATAKTMIRSIKRK